MDDIIIEKQVPLDNKKSIRRLHNGNVGDEKKKDSKKWIFGGLFRRRKKSVDSDSSSQDEAPYGNKGFMASRKRNKKNEKRKKKPVLGTFDHVVIRTNLKENGFAHKEGIMSDPSTGFIDCTLRPEYQKQLEVPNNCNCKETSKSSHESLIKIGNLRTEPSQSGSHGSLDSSSKKRNRERAKQRREKLHIEDHSSSDEGSQRSTNSSLIKIKSDSDSTTRNNRDGSVNRKSRAARTERYIKRLSREDEHVLNREAELVKNSIFKRPTSTSPVLRQRVVHLPATNVIYSSSSQQTTKTFQYPQPTIIKKPPVSRQNSCNSCSNESQRNYNRELYMNLTNSQHSVIPQPKTEEPIQYPQKVVNPEYYMPKQKSWSFENNINRQSPILQNKNNSFSYYTPPNYPLHSSYIKNPPHAFLQSVRTHPPPPPPRDPQRRIVSVANFYENSQRPVSYAFEVQQKNQACNNKIIQVQDPNLNVLNNNNRSASMRSVNSVNYPPINYNNSMSQNINFRSNSDVYISQIPPDSRNNYRPASVTPDTRINNGPKRFITRHRSNPTEQAKYQFFTDQIPRSRKPIHIIPISNESPKHYLSDSQVDAYNEKLYISENSVVQNATEFWKQKEKEEVLRKKEKNVPKELSKKQDGVNTHLFNGKMYENFSKSEDRSSDNEKKLVKSPENKSPHDSLSRKDSNSFRPLSMVVEKPETVEKNQRDPPIPPLRRSSRQNSSSSIDMSDWMNSEQESEKLRQGVVRKSPIPTPRKNIPSNNVDCVDGNFNSVNSSNTKRCKSTNLEDALNELEEIYKSLHLGDEDLLERAERRDIPNLNRILDNSYSNMNETKYSSSSVESLLEDSNGMRRKHISRRSAVPDKVTDDMAYRKLHRNDHSPTLSSPTVVSQISYLLATPDLTAATLPSSSDFSSTDGPSNPNEPDITLDDVVYRNLKQANSTLKVIDPQPPFGIPLGPISPAANSDYLHSKPEERARSRFIPQKSPDLVKDDLAFRSLRKDQIKDALLAPEDFKNNNNEILPKNNDLRKKRAVRSLSANLYNIIQRETMKSNIVDIVELEKTNTSSDMKNEFRSQFLNEMNNGNPNEFPEIYKNFQHQRLRICIPNENSKTSNATYIKTKNSEESQKATVSPSKVPSTLINAPTLDVSEYDKAQLEELLITLAKETQEESKKLEIELQELGDAIDMNDVKTSNNNIKLEKSQDQLNSIDQVSEHAKLCEKLLECVKESTELISSNKYLEKPSIQETFDEIDTVSDHAKICENLIENIVESAELLTVEDLNKKRTHESNIQKSLKEIDNVSKQTKEIQKILESVVVSTGSRKNSPEIMVESNNEGSKKKTNVVTEIEITPIDNEVVEQMDDESDFESIIANVILLRKPDSPSELLLDTVESDRLSTSEIVKSDDYDNIDDVLSSVTDTEDKITSEINTLNENSHKHYSNQIDKTGLAQKNKDYGDQAESSEKYLANTKNCSLNNEGSSYSRGDHSRGCKMSPWYKEPETFALACAYFLACTHQFATMDVLTLIGLILAVISVLAALTI